VASKRDLTVLPCTLEPLKGLETTNSDVDMLVALLRSE